MFLGPANIKFAGTEDCLGRPCLRYNYTVSQLFSGYDLVNERGTARVAFSGSFWADPETASLVRIVVQADGIPSYLDVRSAGTNIRYGDVRLDVRPAAARPESGVYVSVETRRFVLPQSASLRLVRGSGEEKRNSVEFTHCREYSAESKLASGDPDVSAPALGPAEIALPPGLTVKAKLATAIDSAQARVASGVKTI